MSHPSPAPVTDGPDRPTGKRQELREKNRLALLEATLASIAEKGIAETSVSEIIARAGLSRGMIHLHFGGKENLVEAAAELSNERYYEQLEKHLAASGERPQDKVVAIVRSDLSEEVLNTRNVSVWYAFRGEARQREVIAAFSDTRDTRLGGLAKRSFVAIARAEGMAHPRAIARDASNGTLAILEGMWTDYLLHPDKFDRDDAARIVFRFLAAMFPAHFCLTGAR